MKCLSGGIMTKSDVTKIIYRYPYIAAGIKADSPQIHYYKGNRKETIVITEEIKIVCAIITEVYESEPDEWIRFMIRSILRGVSNKNIMIEMPMEKNAYEERKKNFIRKVFMLCAKANLVSREDILNTPIEKI